jgi:hypothetical protein
MSSDEGIPVVLSFDTPRLVLPPDTAVEVMRILANSNAKVLDSNYKKCENTGRYLTEYMIRPLTMDKCSIKFLSASEYLLFTTNGDKSE